MVKLTIQKLLKFASILLLITSSLLVILTVYYPKRILNCNDEKRKYKFVFGFDEITAIPLLFFIVPGIVTSIIGFLSAHINSVVLGILVRIIFQKFFFKNFNSIV